MTEGIQTGPDIADDRVAAVFNSYPEDTRINLLKVRSLILETAENLDSVGSLTETLKWNQPAYLPTKPRIGTTVRIGARKDATLGYAIYFHCQTTLVGQFRELYPENFTYQGNRALLFGNGDMVDQDALRHCVGLALTYHLKS